MDKDGQLELTAEWKDHLIRDEANIAKDHEESMPKPVKSTKEQGVQVDTKAKIEKKPSPERRGDHGEYPEYNLYLDIPENSPHKIHPHISVGFSPGEDNKMQARVESLKQHMEALNIENESLRRLVRQNSQSRSQSRLARQDTNDIVIQPDHFQIAAVNSQDVLHMMMTQAKIIERCIQVL